MMSSFLFVGGILIGATIAGLRLLAWLASRVPDAAWQPTGLRFTTGRDYLQTQGLANAVEARKHTARGRRYRRDDGRVAAGRDVRTLTLRPPAEVVPLLPRCA